MLYLGSRQLISWQVMSVTILFDVSIEYFDPHYNIMGCGWNSLLVKMKMTLVPLKSMDKILVSGMLL